MIFAIIVALNFLCLSKASSDFHLSPISIIRPLHDVHARCEKDIQMFCMDRLEHEESGGKRLRRRLDEQESGKVTLTRTYSFTISLNFGDKDKKLPIQHAKDSKRFLNYGNEADTCLWNAFDSKQVSNKCASALMYVNDSIDYTQNKDGYTTRYSTSTISIPSSTITIVLLSFFIYKFLSSEEDEKADEESVNESEQLAFVAVPLTVV